MSNTLTITSESISEALKIHWLRANEGSLKWGEIMDDIDAMQSLYLYSGGSTDDPEYEDLVFLWSHALSRI